jgi:hypothetical protein
MPNMPNREPNEEPPIWRTVTKLVALAAVLIGGVGLALWYAGEAQNNTVLPAATPSDGTASWGIAGDTPIRKNR